MDGQSIARRLAVVDELYAAWLVLKQARRIEAHDGESPDVAIGQRIK